MPSRSGAGVGSLLLVSRSAAAALLNAVDTQQTVYVYGRFIFGSLVGQVTSRF